MMDSQQPQGNTSKLRTLRVLRFQNSDDSKKKRELFTYKSADFRKTRSVKLCHFVRT